MKIAIIGGGATGLTCGYQLSKQGNLVTVFEKSSSISGLVQSVKIGNDFIEKFYHHIFTNDTEIVDLIEELGLTNKLEWLPPKNSIYINETLYPFTTPMDLLKFKELTFIERLRMGSLVLKAKFMDDLETLDKITAKEWIIKNAGKNVYEKVWKPLLYSKFDVNSEDISGTWIWNKFKLRGSTRGKNVNKELLGYLKGSFQIVYEKLKDKILEKQGVFKLSTNITDISQIDDNKLSISYNDKKEVFDKVIFTAAPRELLNINILLPEKYKENLSRLEYKSNICMMIEYNQQLSDYYWTTIADNNIPFVLFIEHTNLVSKDRYGSNIIYLSRYLDPKDELFGQSDEEIKTLFLDGLKKIFSNFDDKNILSTHISKGRFTQPVVFTGYMDIIPEFETPIKNLYLASMAQIYPQDRGQNYAIKMGKEIAKKVL